MGIAGLLPLFKSVMEPIHVRELRGQRVGIDTYSWLHKAAFSCAKELALGEPTTRHINYVLTRAEMLRSYGVTPVLVFDGGPLPSKKTTNDKRATQRAEKKQLGMEHLKRGNMAAAIECFQSCISITPEIVRQTIDALQRRNIEYMVAPYEADAQLVYLEKIGFISAIITEDSDMIVFGAIRLVLKMDKEGSAVQFNRELMWSTSDIDLKQWNSDKFRKMCILSGCDYLPNIPGIGLKRAHGLMIKFGWNVNRIVGELSSAKKTAQHVPINYLDEFDRAELTFLHQRVYDPFAQDLAHLHPLPPALHWMNSSYRMGHFNECYPD
ncbi:putative exonuclease [Ramicandelaber brevisporus]|nr:putative exonuclease [Ramicandelaber brevisporus]